jgi:succinyl-CoA synthetase alpha subunit
VPVFNTVQEAVDATSANATVIFVPARWASDAILEAIEAKLALIVIITEGIPTLDMVRLRKRLTVELAGLPASCCSAQAGAAMADPPRTSASTLPRGVSCDLRIIGPNCPGVITPGSCKVGIMPGYVHTPGTIGVLSRSGTLTYDAVYQLTLAGLGQSTCIGIGGDPVLGSSFVDLLPLLEEDEHTEAVVLIGEIGGREEEEAAVFIRQHMRKPVFAFVAGRLAPKEKRMGHAGAIISGGQGTAAEKIAILRQAGVTVIESPAAIGQTVKAALH